MKPWKVVAVVAVLILASARAPAQQGNHPQGGRQGSPPPPPPASNQPQPPQPSHKWWQNPKTKADLGLTGDQSARIEEIFQATLPKLQACNTTLEKQEIRLNTMIAASDVSEAEIIKQIDLVEASRSDMGKARTLMLFRMHRLLAPEQRVKLKAMFDQFDRDRRRPPGPDPRNKKR
jgi:Spy/CpxP family protein refolding chaperone